MLITNRADCGSRLAMTGGDAAGNDLARAKLLQDLAREPATGSPRVQALAKAQEVRARQFENDWAKALRGGFLARHIERSEGRGLDRRFRDMLDVENEVVSDT